MAVSFTIRYKDRGVEWHLAIYTTVFGAGLMSPWFSLPKSLTWLLADIPSSGWGAIFLTIGLSHVIALAINGLRWWTPFTRTAMASLNLLAYVLLFAAFVLDAPRSTGVLTYGALTIPMTATTLYRAAKDAFHEMRAFGTGGSSEWKG